MTTVTNSTDALVQATMRKYMTGASDDTVRERLWLSMLEKEGRIEKDADGYDLSWDVQFSQPPTGGYVEFQTHGFSQHQAYKQLTIDVRGNKGTDVLDLKQIVTNRGKHSIVDLWSTKIPNLAEAMAVQLARQAYTDGSASGNETAFCGLKTFLGSGGTCAATDKIAVPDDTYGGLDTDLGQYGGTWSSALAHTAGVQNNYVLANDWPDGQGTSEYDFMSPKIINTTSTAWTGTATWKANCDFIMRAAAGWVALNGKETAPKMHLLSIRNMREAKEHLWEKYRIIQGSNKTANDLGFYETLDFEGTIVSQDFEVPANEGFCMNPNAMDMFVFGAPPGDDFQAQRAGLFWTIGPRMIPGTTVYEAVAVIFGNMRYRPKYFAHYKAIA